jgi:hypothetical protein
MDNRPRRAFGLAVLTAVVNMIFCFVPLAQAQNAALQQKLADIKQSSAANKQALAHYTWMEQQSISL